MKTLLLLLLFAVTVSAQESTSTRLFYCYENAGCPAVGSEREAQAIAGAKDERKPFYRDWQWWAQIGVSGAFAAWDGKSTLDCFKASPLCQEQNPLLGKRPSAGKVYGLGFASLVGQGALTAWLWEHGSGKPVGWAAASARAVLHGIHIRENRENARNFVKEK